MWYSSCIYTKILWSVWYFLLNLKRWNILQRHAWLNFTHYWRQNQPTTCSNGTVKPRQQQQPVCTHSPQKIFIQPFYKCDRVILNKMIAWFLSNPDIYNTHPMWLSVQVKSESGVTVPTMADVTASRDFMAGRQRLFPLDRLSSTDPRIILPLQELHSVSGSSGGGPLWRWRQRALQFLCVWADHLQAEMKER